MTWTVRILEAQEPNGRTVFDVVATMSDPQPDENPDWLVGFYPDRLKAMVAARLFLLRQRPKPEMGQVIAFPTVRRAA